MKGHGGRARRPDPRRWLSTIRNRRSARTSERVRRPQPLLKQRMPSPSQVESLNLLLSGLSINTVCQSASCPNLGECFSEGTATFMILGSNCTRHCRFCAVDKRTPKAVDPEERKNISEAVRRLALKYVVITSPTRDDLPDGGALHFAETIHDIGSADPGVKIEILIPDFQGSISALKTVLEASPAVLGHNMETVPALYSSVRPEAIYERSLEILVKTKQIRPDILTKSGIMLGLGEERVQIIEVMNDLLVAGCDILTLGQYLRPSIKNLAVSRYVPPDEFNEYKLIAERMGFKAVVAGPSVRSSHHAARTYYQTLG